MNESDISRVIELIVRMEASLSGQCPLQSAKDALERHAYDTVLSMAAVAGAAARSIVIVPGAGTHLVYQREASGQVSAFELALDDMTPLLFPASTLSFSRADAQVRSMSATLPASMHNDFFAAAPVRDQEGVACGLLCVTDCQMRDPSATLLTLLDLCALQASQVMESIRRLDEERFAHAQMRNQLEQRDRQLQQVQQEASSLRHEVGSLELLSDTDGLTGIKNRRAFDAAITDELEYASRRPHPVSMLMIDVDNFKTYNDTYGHVKGDEVLKTIALVMQCSLRSFEHVARYGGEEFAMILPNSTSVEARHVARRLQQAVEKYPWPDRPITISIGLATTSSRKTDTPASLIGCADAALYNAKANGRNRVECYA